jgi:ribonuclease-3
VEARLEFEDNERTLASAEGASKKEAQQRAAELALASWPAA